MIVRRAAAYLCQITGADLKRPLEVFFHVQPPPRSVVAGLATVGETARETRVQRPSSCELCHCGRSHSPMIGVTDSDNFLTSVSIGLGSKFWNLCVFDDTLGAKHVSLRDVSETDLAPLSWLVSTRCSLRPWLPVLAHCVLFTRPGGRTI